MLKFLRKINEIKNDNRGATIIIAVAIAFLVMIVSVSLAYQIQNTKTNIVRFRDKNQAKVYAEDVLGILKSEMIKHEAGYGLSEEECKALVTSQLDEENLEVTCSVLGMPTPVNGTGTYNPIANGAYVVPASGTGNAGTDCSLIKPPTGQTTASTDLDDPCNWGKLSFGNSYTSRVLVPLYYDAGEQASGCTEETGEDGFIRYVCNPSGTGMSKLIVRVRTPCKEWVEDTATGERICLARYNIGGNLSRLTATTDEDKTVVNWDISGDCGSQYCSLMPLMEVEQEKTRKLATDSEIFETLIRDMGPNNYSEAINTGDPESPSFAERNKPGYLSTKATEKFINAFLQDITKPVLQLSLIADKLIEDRTSADSAKIPYLEYQVLAEKPISNNSDIYYVFVTYNSQGFKIVESIEQEKNLVDYAVQN